MGRATEFDVKQHQLEHSYKSIIRSATVPIVAAILLWLSPWVQAQSIHYFPIPESAEDTRFQYATELLKKALEKTESHFGSVSLQPSHQMSIDRAFKLLKKAKDLNVIWSSTSVEREQSFLPIRIPIRKGLLGYRIFLIREDEENKFASMDTLEEIKHSRAGQLRTWNDVKVLVENGFNVVTGNHYKALFRMLSIGRFDYFSRGINEAIKEYEENKADIKNLAVEKNLLLYYPWPKYFFVSKEQPELAQRIQRGLEMMLDDGSFDSHLMEYHAEDIAKANLSKRKLFKIENPLLPKETPLSNKNYWFDPFHDL